MAESHNIRISKIFLQMLRVLGRNLPCNQENAIFCCRRASPCFQSKVQPFTYRSDSDKDSRKLALRTLSARVISLLVEAVSVTNDLFGRTTSVPKCPCAELRSAK